MPIQMVRQMLSPRQKKMSKRSKRGMKTRNSKRRKKKKTTDWVLYPLSNISSFVYLKNFILLY